MATPEFPITAIFWLRGGAIDETAYRFVVALRLFALRSGHAAAGCI
jgi:hypothetical protein